MVAVELGSAGAGGPELSIETVRRLLDGGLVPRAEIEVSLLQSVIREISLVQAIATQRGDWGALVEQEFSRATAPYVRRVHPKIELCAVLPVGMCERLLALPVRQEAITRTVDVAAVDPFDSHIQQEFAFHLDAPVRMLRASLADIVAALDGMHTGGAFAAGVSEMLGVQRDTPRHGSEPPPAVSEAETGVEPAATASPSQPPIPLVQRSSNSPRGSASAAPERPLGAPDAHDRGEPDLDATRSIPEASEALTRSRLREADLVQVERQLAQTKSPDDVVELLVEHACPEGSTLVFSIKADGYVARSASFDVQGLRDVSLPRGRPNVFQAALESGHYLGKLPETLVHALIRDLLTERLGPEVYVAPVLVTGRATLMLLSTGFERSFATTRRIDRLAAAAGDALERLLIERKKLR
ncbi:MAG TPA: hypothetical protein VFU02_10525 [Polyangiaceae bacterium]|nr:hypothetical protein [Polyangiaceae bacterium]